jgi:hypothetical protein
MARPKKNIQDIDIKEKVEIIKTIKEEDNIQDIDIIEIKYQIIADSEYLKNLYKINEIVDKKELICKLGLLSFHILRSRNLIKIYE